MKHKLYKTIWIGLSVVGERVRERKETDKQREREREIQRDRDLIRLNFIY